MDISKLLSGNALTPQMKYANLFANNRTSGISMRAGVKLSKYDAKTFKTLISQVDEIIQELEVCGVRTNPGALGVIDSSVDAAIKGLSYIDNCSYSCCLMIDIRHAAKPIDNEICTAVICYVSLVLFKSDASDYILDNADDVINTVFTTMIPLAGDIIPDGVAAHIEDFKIHGGDDISGGDESREY